MRLIVAIIDTKTNDIVGSGFVLHRHEAAAIRMFSDVIQIENSDVKRHIEDMEMWQLGEMNDDNFEITANRKQLITGKQWLAAQEQR